MSSLRIATAAALLLGVGAGAPGAAQAATTAQDALGANGNDVAEDVGGLVQDVQWEDCKDMPEDPFLNLKCAKVAVPKDYDNADGGTYDIQISRRPATSGTSKGTIVVRAGGAGTASWFDVFSWYDTFPKDLVADYDLVGISQRGTEGGDGDRCMDTPEQQHRIYKTLNKVPVSSQDAVDHVAAAKELAKMCQKNLAPELRTMDAQVHARDMNTVREALGLEKISVYAAYGQDFAAQVYAEMFPKTLRAMVIDNFQPGLDVQGTVGNAHHNSAQRTGTIKAHESALRGLLARCDDRGQDYCAMADAPGGEPATAKYDQVVDALVDGPIEYDITVRYLTATGEVDFEYTSQTSFTMELATEIASDAVSYPGFQARLFTTQFDVLHRVVSGEKHVTVDISPPAAWSEGAVDEGRRMAERLKNPWAKDPNLGDKAAKDQDARDKQYIIDPTKDYNPIADPHRVTTCNNTAYSTGIVQARSRIHQATKDSKVFGPELAWKYLHCHAWANPTANPGLSFNAKTEHPIMFITKVHSPLTSLAQARKAVDRYPNATLVVDDGWGYNSYTTNPCVKSRVDAFLADLKEPDVGVCEVTEPIFTKIDGTIVPISADQPGSAETQTQQDAANTAGANGRPSVS